MKTRIFLLVMLLGLFSTLQAQENALTLEECVDVALKHNAEIIMGRMTVDRAGKDVVQARAEFMPDVSARISYYHSVVGPSSMLRIDPGTGIPVPVQPEEIISWSSSAAMTVYQTLFRGGYNFFNYKMNHNLKKSAEYNFDDTRQGVIYQVKERYYNLLKAEKLLGVQEETLRSSEESFKRAQVLYEVGKASKSDMLKAKVQVETDRLALIEAQNSLSIARASLNYILGFNVDHDIRLVDNLEVPEVEVSYEDALENALSQHPALLRGRYDVKAMKAGIGVAVSRFLPSVTAYFQYSWNHQDFNKISNLFDKDYSYYMGVQLSLPIFQGFSRIASTSQAKLDYRSSQEALDQIKLQVGLEVKQAYFEQQQAKRAIAVARDAVEAAEEDLRLNKEKYGLGAGTMLDLINAQVSATTAKSDHIQALYDYKYAIARLQKAMGTLEK
jgi:TolC family type I secretion outer membrane protein